MPVFTINFANNSNSEGRFCLFQRKHNCDYEAVSPLAWLVRNAVSHSVASVSWNTDFHFFHSATSQLGPGVHVKADEKLKASLTKTSL